MKVVNTLLEKAAQRTGKLPTNTRPSGDHTDPSTTEYHIAQIYDYVSHSIATLPVVVAKAEGAYLWDVTGKKYIDFMSSYGCANQGHNHPKIREALIKQAQTLPISSIVTHHNLQGPSSKHLTSKFGYDKILWMNSGAEAVDSAVLSARRWGYQVKNISKGKATVLFPRNNYWGLLSACRTGEDESALRSGVDPLPTEEFKFDFVDFDNVEQLENKFSSNSNICAYIFEPIQGHAGNIHPSPGYYAKVRELCDKYQVLMVADEVQSGLGRTGRLFTTEWEGVKPDMVTLGKALGADFLPVSALLANNDVMNLWEPGMHTSTYSANSLACAVAVAAVDTIFEEDLVQKAERLGKIVEEEFNSYGDDYPFITKKYCGKGLYCSLELSDNLTCMLICQILLKKGVLVIPSSLYLKVMPPLVISEADLRAGLKILREALDEHKAKGKTGLAADITKDILQI